MLPFLACLAAAAAAATEPLASEALSDPCAGDPSCRQVSAAELFAAADAAAAEGDLVTAEALLVALTGDPDPELRAEARFRLAAARERLGDLGGAAEALRALLAEKPAAQRARLELSRILALQGDQSGARRELARASERGLPPDVALTVRRFSTALRSQKRRGLALDLAAGFDSNVNRATSDRFIDTVIAPFELDADARGQKGVGASIGVEAWSRDRMGGLTLMSRAGARGDLFLDKSRFNDIQLSLSSGPELSVRAGRIRPALLHERRWYGGDAYSRGTGGTVNWMVPVGLRNQIQLDGAAVRQTILKNSMQSGWRYSLGASLDHGASEATAVRLTLRGAWLDAAVRPESLRQGGLDALVIHQAAAATVFAQAGYTRTEGLAEMPLFGRTRADDRIDLGAGLIAGRIRVQGFAPLVRVTFTDSRSNLALYNYRRIRLDFGFTREF